MSFDYPPRNRKVIWIRIQLIPTYYKAVRVFDPRQLAIVEHDIADYQAIPGLRCPSAELHEEWLIHMQLLPSSVATSTTIPVEAYDHR